MVHESGATKQDVIIYNLEESHLKNIVYILGWSTTRQHGKKVVKKYLLQFQF